jgi:hypothetical protein
MSDSKVKEQLQPSQKGYNSEQKIKSVGVFMDIPYDINHKVLFRRKLFLMVKVIIVKVME